MAEVKRTAEDLALLKAEIRRGLAERKSDRAIAADAGISIHEYIPIKKALMREETVNARKPAVETFVEYQIRQLANIDELEQVRVACMNKDQPQHATAAIRGKADLLDRIITKGQDLGVYHKEGQKVQVTGAMGLVHMTPGELAGKLDSSMAKLQALSVDLGRPLALSEPGARVIIDPSADLPEAKELTTSPEPPTHPETGDSSSAPVAMKEHERILARQPGAMKNKAPGRKRKKPKDPYGISKRQYLQCPECGKACAGIPALAMHMRGKHKTPAPEARATAQRIADETRAALAAAAVASKSG